MPSLSVILCTFNPRSDLFSLALRSIAAQSLGYGQFEVIVVDNNSAPPIDEPAVGRLIGRDVRVVVERRQGLTYARVAGIRAARGRLLVFVDDDNDLHSEYLQAAAAVADSHPHLGTFGGAAHGSLEESVNYFKRPFLAHLGIRDHGQDRIEGPADEWGPWEPIGAGLVVRRAVAERYADFVEDQGAAGELGRCGGVLMSGEDTLMTRLAGQLGYRCSYEPSLRLNHHIPRQRLTCSYLSRLIYGHGRSFVVLASLTRVPMDAPPERRRWLALWRNFVHRWRHESLSMAVGMVWWDLGFQHQYSVLLADSSDSD